MVSFIDIIRTLGELKEEVSIKTLTSFRIGGIAKYVVYPNDLNSLKQILTIISENNYPYKIWGMGSNILASDDYYTGIIIKLDKLLNKIEINDNTVLVGAGVSLINLAYKTCLLGYSGFEYATGIPGSVGGALYMNAGAYKHDTYEILKRVHVLRNGKFEWLDKNEIQFSYRHTSFSEQKDWIILEAEFNLLKGSMSDIQRIVNDRKERRMKSQPLNLPSAGSVFRNPDAISAWQIIDEVGLRGKKIGGAMISDIHSNFIVNFDNAKAQDVLDLIVLAKTLVKERMNIELIPEIELFNWSNK
jgi:UDP-N-acetylmuramate dehydrogenase